MKLIEAMKELRLIEKKIVVNTNRIQQYSSGLDIEKAAFGGETEQEKEVSSLVQSNLDLVENYAKTKSKIEFTNLSTQVTINDITKSISQWLTYKRKLGKLVLNTYQALSEDTGNAKRKAVQGFDEIPKITRFYDEKEKNENLNNWMEIIHTIDSRLEVVNAQTDLDGYGVLNEKLH